MRVADYILDTIVNHGVRDVFFLPGGGAMHLNNALIKNKNIRAISMLHEQGAAIAAEGYARTSGKFGVCMVTSGPGATNAITGLSGAWFESTPVMFISGQVKRADLKGHTGLRQLGTQELDIVSVVQSISKYAVCLTDPLRARFELEKAMYLMRSGRPGPVWIDVPLDVQATEIDPTELESFTPPEIPAAEQEAKHATVKAAVEQVSQFLVRAERPVLLVGNGIHCAGAEEDLLKLIKLLNIPTQTTWIAADLLEFSHPLYFGRPGTVAARGANFTIQNSDLVIAIGSRLDFSITGFNRKHFARSANIVVVDVDKAEIEKLGDMPDCAIVSDAKDFIQRLYDVCKKLQPPDYSSWIARCTEWKQRYPVVLPSFHEQTGYANTYVFTEILCEELDDSDMIIPGSSGASIDTFWLSAKLKKGQRAVPTGGLGAMGYGLPAAIGGCIGSGGKRTIAVDGDGGFMLNMQELEVAKRLNLPIKFFVLNNNGYASIRASQNSYFKAAIGCDSSSGLTLPDISKLAHAFDIPSFRISDQADLRDSIRAVLGSDGPAICEVMVQPDQTIGPRITSKLGKDGSMVSSPLEDLSPFLEREEFHANMIIPVIEE